MWDPASAGFRCCISGCDQLGQGVHKRTHERVLFDRSRKSGPDGVLQNVPGNHECLFAVADDALEAVTLPETCAELPHVSSAALRRICTRTRSTGGADVKTGRRLSVQNLREYR